jgi:hypothetical protein
MPRLAAALAKAQQEISNAEKNAEAELSFKDGSARRLLRYANLAAVFNAVRPALSKNGIAVTQLIHNDANGTTVTTRLMHESGEYLENAVWLPVSIKSPQGYGSAITYARRYGLQALVGLAAEEDDDAQAAAPAGAPSQQTSGAQRAAQRLADFKAKQQGKKEQGKKEEPTPQQGTPSEPVVEFGPDSLKGRRISELEGAKLLELSFYAKKRLADPATQRASWRPAVELNLQAIDAELAKREAALKAAADLPEPGSDLDERP